MTEFLNVEGGRIAYDVTGDGPLLVRSPGMENRRNAYRFLAPQLVAAGCADSAPVGIPTRIEGGLQSRPQEQRHGRIDPALSASRKESGYWRSA
jgi:hypothetical protein